MDVKEEDRSEESRRDHARYYASLGRTISDITAEMGQERDPAILNHLRGRIEAMEKDRQRIREMFPGIGDR